MALKLSDIPPKDQCLLPALGGAMSVTKSITCLQPRTSLAFSVRIEVSSTEDIARYGKMDLELSVPSKPGSFGDAKAAKLWTLYERNAQFQEDVKRMTPEQYSEKIEELRHAAQALVNQEAEKLDLHDSTQLVSQADVARLLKAVYRALDRSLSLQYAVRYIVVEGPFPGIPEKMRFFDVPVRPVSTFSSVRVCACLCLATHSFCPLPCASFRLEKNSPPFPCQCDYPLTPHPSPSSPSFPYVQGWGDDLRPWDKETLTGLITSESIVMLATSRAAKNEDIAPLAKLLWQCPDDPPFIVNTMMFREDDDEDDDDCHHPANSDPGRSGYLHRFSQAVVQTVRDEWIKEKERTQVRPLNGCLHYLTTLGESVAILYQLYDSNPDDIGAFLDYASSRQLIWKLRSFANSVAGSVFLANVRTSASQDKKKAGTPQYVLNMVVKQFYKGTVRGPLLEEQLKCELHTCLYNYMDTLAAPAEGAAPVTYKQRQQPLTSWLEHMGMRVIQHIISEAALNTAALICINMVKKVWYPELQEQQSTAASQMSIDSDDDNDNDDDAGAAAAAGDGGDGHKVRAAAANVKAGTSNAAGKPARRGAKARAKAAKEAKTRADAYVKHYPQKGLSWFGFTAKKAVSIGLEGLPALTEGMRQDCEARMSDMLGLLKSMLSESLWQTDHDDFKKFEKNLAAKIAGHDAQAAKLLRNQAKYHGDKDKIVEWFEAEVLPAVTSMSDSFVQDRLKAVQESMEGEEASKEVRDAVATLSKASQKLAKENYENRLSADPRAACNLASVVVTPKLGEDAFARIEGMDMLRYFTKSSSSRGPPPAGEMPAAKAAKGGKRSGARQSSGAACAADGNAAEGSSATSADAPAAGVDGGDASAKSKLPESWYAKNALPLLQKLLLPDFGAAQTFDVRFEAHQGTLIEGIDLDWCGLLSFQDPAAAVLRLPGPAVERITTTLSTFVARHVIAKSTVWPMFQVLMTEEEAWAVADMFKGEKRIDGDIAHIHHFCMYLCANEAVLRALVTRIQALNSRFLEQQMCFAVAVSRKGLQRTDVLLELARVLCLKHEVKYFWLLPPTPTSMYVFDDLTVRNGQCSFLAGLRSCEVILEALEHVCVSKIILDRQCVTAAFQAYMAAQKGTDTDMGTDLFMQILHLQSALQDLGKKSAAPSGDAEDGVHFVSCGFESLMGVLKKYANDMPAALLADIIKPMAIWLRASTLYSLPSHFSIKTRLVHDTNWHVIARSHPRHTYLSPVLFSTFACASASLVSGKNQGLSLSKLPFAPVPQKGANAVAGVQSVNAAVKRYIDNKLYPTRKLLQLAPLKVSFRQTLRPLAADQDQDQEEV